jgi:uncharacterized protein YuzE
VVNFEFSYDEENDDLLIFRKNIKSKGSVELGDNLVLDFDSKKNLNAMEIMNATEFISKFTDKNKRTVKNILKNLIKCQSTSRVSGNLVLTKVTLFSSYKQEKAELPVTYTNIKSKSPALAYA